MGPRLPAREPQQVRAMFACRSARAWVVSVLSKHKASGEEGSGRLALRPLKEACGLLMLDDPAAMQEEHVSRQPPRLADIMRDHDDLHAAMLSVDEEFFDGKSGGRVEASGRLVEEQNTGLQA